MLDLNDLLPFNSHNNESLAQFFFGFFKYYLFRFDFTKYVASVGLGRAFKKCLIVYKENPNQLKLICIEEPFS
jgi:DNA polymerase sigma